MSQLTILKTDMLLNISNVMRTEILSEIETYNVQRDALFTDSDISDDETKMIVIVVNVSVIYNNKIKNHMKYYLIYAI